MMLIQEDNENQQLKKWTLLFYVEICLRKILWTFRHIKLNPIFYTYLNMNLNSNMMFENKNIESLDYE